MDSTDCENQTIDLERGRNAYVERERLQFFEIIKCPMKSRCSSCLYQLKKLKCIDTILAFLEPYNRKINSYLFSRYKSKIKKDFKFTDELIKMLLAFYLQNCYRHNQSPNKYAELFSLQQILHLCTDGDIDVLTYYISYVRKCIDGCISKAAIKAQLLKFLKVFQTIPEESIIKPFELTDKNITMYEDIAHFLKVCYDRGNMDNSGIVTNLLKIIFKMHLKNTNYNFFIKHIDYDPNFLKYILHHCDKEGFELKEYVSNYSNTVWSYHSKISIINAVANGDVESLYQLLDLGFEIYSEEQQQKCHYLYHNIPTHYQIILEVMLNIIESNRGEVEDLCIGQDQVHCFRILWEEIPYSEVTVKELYRSIMEEELIIDGHAIQDERRRRNLRKLAFVFKKFFCIATESEPCSLQKLCRIKLRKSFREALRTSEVDQILTIGDLKVYYRFESELIKPAFEKYLS